MRLNNVWIDGYKNLNDFCVSFKNDSYLDIFLGKNGTGKSNLFESLILIFESLVSKNSSPTFSYQVEYEISKHKISVSYNTEVKERKIFIDGKSSSIKEIDSYIPRNIVLYYSGWSNRLEEDFKKFERQYKRKERKSNFALHPNEDLFPSDTLYPSNLKFSQTEVRFTNISKIHFDLILFSLLAFANKSSILTFLNDYIGISGFEDINIILKQPNSKNEFYTDTGDFWGINESSKEIIRSLESCSLNVDSYSDKLGLDSTKRFYKIKMASDDRFLKLQTDFNKPSILFQKLETLRLNNLLGGIETNLKLNNDMIISSNQLSEGQKQIILNIGLIYLLEESDSLILLDEPDTFLHPEWQRQFCDITEKINDAKQNVHVLLATHSPFIVQSTQNNNIFLLKESQGHSTIESNLPSLENGRIDWILTSDLFGLKSSRPVYTDDYMELRKEILSKKELNPEDKKKLEKFASNGILPSGETLDDIKAMKIIHEAAKAARMMAYDKNK